MTRSNWKTAHEFKVNDGNASVLPRQIAHFLMDLHQGGVEFRVKEGKDSVKVMVRR